MDGLEASQRGTEFTVLRSSGHGSPQSVALKVQGKDGCFTQKL